MRKGRILGVSIAVMMRKEGLVRVRRWRTERKFFFAKGESGKWIYMGRKA